MRNNKKIEIHGHRGCRGYFPENTINGFLHALDFDTDAIEMDVVVSKDLQVVVSHEHFMHHKKCLRNNLMPITREEELDLFIYQMDYAAVKLFDCGLLSHPNFPKARTENAYKPLLKDVIAQVELACKTQMRKPVIYNIEIKSEPHLIGKGQPDYELYVKLILDEIGAHQIANRVIIQSFDKEILRSIRNTKSQIPLSLLIEDQIDPLVHIEQLGFLPSILASDYIFLNKEKTANLQANGIKVYAFTVNEIEVINQMISYDVDAIITDYPDLGIQCLESYK